MPSGRYLQVPYIFNRFEWRRLALLYESQAFEETVGQSGGFLLASTLNEFLVLERFEVHARELQLQNSLQDQLIQNVGNDYASELLSVRILGACKNQI